MIKILVYAGVIVLVVYAVYVFLSAINEIDKDFD